MEFVNCIRDTEDGELFRKLVFKGFDGCPSLPDDGYPHFVFLDVSTVKGQPGCVIAFKVRLPDGTWATAQTVVTLNNLKGVMAAMEGWYGDGSPRDQGVGG